MALFTHKTFSYQRGDEIAGYRVVAPAGLGGFGEVYLVEDVSGARFALKLFHDRRELEALARYREIPIAPELAVIHAAGRLDDKVFYLTDAADNLKAEPEYLPDTLANRLAKGAFSATDALQTVAAILRGLDVLHRQNLAHGDVKPENVIFVKGKIKLADFGSLASPETLSGGSPGFLPPEVTDDIPTLADGIDRDLYAAGKVLYVLYSDRAPEEFPLPRENAVPRDFALLRRIYAKACHTKAQYRFHSAREMLEAVEKALKKLQSPRPERQIFWFILLAVIAVASVYASDLYQKKRAESAMFVARVNKINLDWELEQLQIMRSLADDAHRPVIDRRIADIQRLLQLKKEYKGGILKRNLRNSVPLDQDAALCAYRKQLMADPLHFLTKTEYQQMEALYHQGNYPYIHWARNTFLDTCREGKSINLAQRYAQEVRKTLQQYNQRH